MFFQVIRKCDEIEGMIETGWDFFSKPYTDEKVLKDFGMVTIDGEDYQITNHMMQSVLELVGACRSAMKQRDTLRSEHSSQIRELERKLEFADWHAGLSDDRIGDQLDKEIEWFHKHEGEESLIYGPTRLMGYARDRLRRTP